MIGFFVRHPTAANLFMAALLVIGVVATPGLLRETFPRIAPRKVQITIVYPGAAPEEVSRAICQRVEDAIDGVENVDEVQCEARENVAVTTVSMVQGGDLDRFNNDIETEINGVNDFPDSTEAPVIRQLGRADFVATVAITAEGAPDRTELKALAEDVKTRMLRHGGVPQVEVTGFSDPQFRIEIPDMAARRLGLTLEDVARAVSRQNVDLPVGEIVSERGSTLLRFSDQRRGLDAYADIPVASSPQGGEVLLGDIARIDRRFEDEEVNTTFNGQPAALLRITKTPSDDTLRVMAALRDFLAIERAQLPPSVKLTITGDSSGILLDRLRMLVVNSLQGLALVFAAMWLFFGLRQAFWIGFGLPVSFLGALAMMAALGLSINMLTMVGLLIVIGILMDDAIVIAENIATKRASGLSALDAAIEGTRQVSAGVISSFATTVAIFGSLAFLKGDLGEILRVIPIVMILVLMVSLIEAFMILPAHLSHGDHGPPKGPRRADRALDWARQRIVGPLARAAVSWRYLTLGIAIMVFLSAVSMLAGGKLKFQAFPEIDGDQIEARLELTAGASLEQTRAEMAYVLAALDRVDKALSPRNPGGAPLVRYVVVTYNENADAGATGAHLATAKVDLLGAETRGADLDTILALWRREAPQTPAMRRLNLTEGAFGPAGRAIELRLAHDDVSVLAAASADLRDWLSRYAGAYNIADDLQPGRPELKMRLKEGAGVLGLDARGVADQVRAAFYGVTADEVQARGENYEVDVRLDARDRDSLGDIDTFTLSGRGGARAPLGAVVDLEESRGYARINRIDGRPTVTITGDVDTARGNASEIVNDTVKNFLPKLEARYPGLSAGTEGQNAEAAKTQKSMAQGLVLGLIAVYFVLSLQLRSYWEPVVVMVIIPFALIGAVYGHMAMGLDMSMPSMLGFVSLAGIVVNDSILLVNFIKNEHAPGVVSVAEAAPQAAMARFRAILLTSVTTIVGVIPLMTETSLQAQVLIPLVTSIAFGLTTTTLLIMLVTPAFYAILDDLGLTSLAAERRLAARLTEGADPA